MLLLGLICIIVVIVIISAFLCLIGLSGDGLAARHLENKYDVDFEYVKILDSPINVSNIIEGTEYYFISSKGEKVSVVCGKDKYTKENACLDSYYKYIIHDDMLNKIKSITSKYISNQKIQMKFRASVFKDSFGQNTTLDEALAESSVNLHVNVAIITYDLGERSINRIEQNMWNEIEKEKLNMSVRIFNVTLNEYNSLQADSKGELSEQEFNELVDSKGVNSFKPILNKVIKSID